MESVEKINKISLLSCGTELLMGQILNTNVVYLAKQLNQLGFSSEYQMVVGDNPLRLKNSILELLNNSDAVIITGGLGPTEDDISMETAAYAVGCELEYNQVEAQKIEDYFRRTGRQTTANNYKQAYLPKQGEGLILPNDNGTAPGAIFYYKTTQNQIKYLILLPGPPNENQLMFTNYVKPFLAERSMAHFTNHYFRLFGIGESKVAMEIADLIAEQTNPTIALYCSSGEVCIRLTLRENSPVTTDATTTTATALAASSTKIPSASGATQLSELKAIIKKRLGQYIYSEADHPDLKLPEVLATYLKKRNLKIAFAESCTAGKVSDLLATIPGISSVLQGGIVAYNDQIKTRILKVQPETLNTYTAVSAETAIEMAKGAQELFGSDIAVSVTGFAGPKSIDPIVAAHEEVGRVYIGVASANGTSVQTFKFNGNRQKVRDVAAIHALGLVWQVLVNEENA